MLNLARYGLKKIEDGGKDFEVTVEFDRVGVKKCLHHLPNY